VTYNPNIPAPTDQPSASQGQFLTNFGQLNTLFNFDHVAWNDATVANRGLHRKVAFIQAVADPIFAFPITQLYTKTSTNAVVNQRFNDLYYYEKNTAGTTNVLRLTGGGITASSYVRFNGITAALISTTPYNITSVVRTGVGAYIITFTRQFVDGTYTVFVSTNDTNQDAAHCKSTWRYSNTNSNQCQLQTFFNGALADLQDVSVLFFGILR
jgi:hypothetical protein